MQQHRCRGWQNLPRNRRLEGAVVHDLANDAGKVIVGISRKRNFARRDGCTRPARQRLTMTVEHGSSQELHLQEHQQVRSHNNLRVAKPVQSHVGYIVQQICFRILPQVPVSGARRSYVRQPSCCVGQVVFRRRITLSRPCS